MTYQAEPVAVATNKKVRVCVDKYAVVQVRQTLCAVLERWHEG